MAGRTHFVMSYPGNKRTEIKEILKDIDLSNIRKVKCILLKHTMVR